MDEIPANRAKEFEKGLIEFMTKSHPGVGEKIRQSKKFEPETETALKSAIAEFKTQFKATLADASKAPAKDQSKAPAPDQSKPSAPDQTKPEAGKKG
jgi:hypothetical protein